MSRLPHHLAGFVRRHPRVAPIAWVLTWHYFTAQFITAAVWEPGYNWAINSVSDLGVTVCHSRYEFSVCSPLCLFFNLSLIVTGIAMSLGAILLYFQVRATRTSLLGFACLVAAGIGAILVGTYPSNSIDLLHHLGTGLAFVGGTTGVAILAVAMRGEPTPVRYGTLASAVLALAGLVLLALFYGFDIGLKGVAERVGSYPLILWFGGFGLYLATRAHRNLPRGRRTQP